MTGKIIAFFFGIAACLLAASCTPKLYGENEVSKSQLTPAAYDSLKSFLLAKGGRPLHDTLIVKYEFNRETCWDFLDQQSEAYIKQVIDGRATQQKLQEQSRPGISVFHFREEGKQFNKIVKWDNAVLVDDGFLRRLLFRERTTCGTSAVVLPSGAYRLTKSDPHFTSLYR